MSSDIRQMPALQTASIRSPSKRPLAENCCPCAILAASHLPLLAVLDGLLKPMQNVCNRSPHLSEEPGGSHGHHDQGRYTLSRHVSECLLHSRRHVDDVTLLPLSLAAPAFDPPLLVIVYLLCQVAVLRSNSEKQRFEFLVVSAGCASLVRGCPA